MTPAEVRDALETLLAPQGFNLDSCVGPDATAMGAWYIEFRSPTLIVTASQDRTGDSTSICVGSLVRRAPRKQMRGPWSLSHLRGYFDNARIHHSFKSVSDQLAWLRAESNRILDSDMLNSDELNDWAVSASHVMFGQNRPNSG
jgi:hypothetical protein